jgi:hypothetical protein
MSAHSQTQARIKKARAPQDFISWPPLCRKSSNANNIRWTWVQTIVLPPFFETLLLPGKKPARTGKKTGKTICKPMAQEENQEKAPRWSWAKGNVK